MSNSRLIGTLQGRLVLPTNGQLQCFPYGRWEEEFRLARTLGLGAIELLDEAEENPENPLVSSDGVARLLSIIQETGVKVLSICIDSLMKNALHHPDSRQFTQKRIDSLLPKAKQMGAKRLVLPFFEQAEIHNKSEFELLKEGLVPCLDAAAQHGIELAFESSLEGADLLSLLEDLHHPSACVCYDLGNTTAFGHELGRDIRLLGNHIHEVHVKDRRKSKGPNVLLGTGDTNFDEAFRALGEIGYKGPFMLETQRGTDPLETAARHRQFVLDHLDKHLTGALS